MLVDVSRTILDRNKTIPPTITVDAGTRINVNVAADMDFLEPSLYVVTPSEGMFEEWAEEDLADANSFNR